MSALQRARGGVLWACELLTFALACTVILPATGVLKLCRAVKRKILHMLGRKASAGFVMDSRLDIPTDKAVALSNITSDQARELLKCWSEVRKKSGSKVDNHGIVQ